MFSSRTCYWKLLSLLIALLLPLSPSLAAEVTIASVPDALIASADNAIAQGKITVDKLLTAMQAIHETQKSDLKSALEKGNLLVAQKTLDQRNQMYPLTNHLYALKAGAGKNLTNTSGTTYTFNTQAPLPRLNLSRGEDAYYSFPKQDSFLELQRNLTPAGGAVYNEVSLISQTQKYLPKYFYAGNNTLQDTARRDEGAKLTELPEEDIDIYCFYDLPLELMTTQNFSITLTNGTNIPGKDVYATTSYSPDYYLTSLDKGFQFCQEVAKFI